MYIRGLDRPLGASRGRGTFEPGDRDLSVGDIAEASPRGSSSSSNARARTEFSDPYGASHPLICSLVLVLNQPPESGQQTHPAHVPHPLLPRLATPGSARYLVSLGHAYTSTPDLEMAQTWQEDVVCPSEFIYCVKAGVRLPAQ